MDTVIIIALGILGLGIILCLGLIFWGKRKAKAIIHYEKLRDELSLRDEEECEEETEYGGGMLGNIIGGFITLFVGFTLLPIIQDEVAMASTYSNITSTMTPATQTMLNMAPIFFMITIVIIATSIIFAGLRSAGIIGYEYDYKKKEAIKHYEKTRDKMSRWKMKR